MQDKETVQVDQNLYNATMLLSKAFSFMLEENDGIVVDVFGDVKLPENVKKVVIVKVDGDIKIFNFDEDLPEGSFVRSQQIEPENKTEENQND